MKQTQKQKPKVLFVYDHEYPHLWKDGLWAALQLLFEDFDVITCNLQVEELFNYTDYDFVLGWGGFESRVDRAIRELPIRKGLCIGGNAFPPVHADDYDVLFYETDWYAPELAEHRNARKAFGINSQIYFNTESPKIFDVISVGAFADWKRHYLLRGLKGHRLAIGQVQRGNLEESFHIISHLIGDGVMVSDMVEPRQLAKLYNASSLCYIPADLNGGGERAVLEARACRVEVRVENDNPKLKELTTCPIPNEFDYAKALKDGINSVL